MRQRSEDFVGLVVGPDITATCQFLDARVDGSIQMASTAFPEIGVILFEADAPTAEVGLVKSLWL